MRASRWIADGRIQGIVASKTGSGRLDQGINKVSEKYPSFADLLGTVKQAVLKDADANIDYKPGVEMTIALTKPLDWTGAVKMPDIASIEPEDELFRLVNSEPFRTATQKDQRPSDITNLMFLGSRQQIEDAFQKGWLDAGGEAERSIEARNLPGHGGDARLSGGSGFGAVAGRPCSRSGV